MQNIIIEIMTSKIDNPFNGYAGFDGKGGYHGKGGHGGN